MCQLFIEADSQLWTYRTKSLRIDGVVTSIRLEGFFWDILEELAFRDQMTVSQMITKLYHESLDAEHDISNFTSFLRVCASRYLSLIADGDLTRDTNTSLANINSQNLLEKERFRTNQRKARFSISAPKASIN